MNTTWQHAQRRIKQVVAGTLFVGILIGASGTVFTAFSDVISQLGSSSGSSVAAVSVTSAPPAGSQTPTVTPQTSTVAPQTPALQPTSPVLEYSTSSGVTQTTGIPSVPTTGVPDPADASNSALASAMDTGGIYIGERVQSVFGSMLKGILNTLFINTN